MELINVVLDFRAEDLVSSTCIEADHEATREQGRPDKRIVSLFFTVIKTSV